MIVTVPLENIFPMGILWNIPKYSILKYSKIFRNTPNYLRVFWINYFGIFWNNWKVVPERYGLL